MHDPDPDPTHPDPARPGSPEALDGGCLCSVLLNRSPDEEDQGFVDPLCPVHGAQGAPVGATPAETTGRSDP